MAWRTIKFSPEINSTSGAPEGLQPVRPATDAEIKDLYDLIVKALRTVYDPEIPVNIYEMGLIYAIDIGTDRAVAIRMTLTSPGCPVAGSLPAEVEAKVRAIPGVTDVQLDLVWEPPWTMDMMSAAARLELNLD
jgi:FeS assembly SUF system protein